MSRSSDINPEVNADQDALEKQARESIIAGSLPPKDSTLEPQPSSEPPVQSLLTPDRAVLRRTMPANRKEPFTAHPSGSRLNLYILRHASAGTRRANPKIDVKRPLDKDGKRHCLHLAHVLNGLKLNFDLIVSSPLKRCLQTAQLIGTETGYETRILHAKGLEPQATYAQFQRLIGECRAYENVLMVGHNPTLTQFLGQLIAPGLQEEDVSAKANVRMRKGTIARVSLDRGPALLQWMLDPRLVRALYDTSTKSARRKVSRK